MKLTTSYPDTGISDKIMDFLYWIMDVQGDEEYLINEKVLDITGPHTFLELEISLEKATGENITLPKDLKLIEKSN